MLVLSRKIDEEVVMAGVGRAAVIDIRGDKVRLGFDLPSEVRVDRTEVMASVVSDLEVQIPDDCSDKRKVVEFLFAEIAFEAFEKRRNAASDAALGAVESIGEDIEVEYNGKRWLVTSSPAGPVAFSV